jgi:hypothetical protein
VNQKRGKGAVGRHEETEPIPDCHGLPEFFVTDIKTEIIGANVRLFAGSRRGNHVHWLYSVVLPAESLILIGQQCLAAGEEAFNIAQMMMMRRENRAGH